MFGNRLKRYSGLIKLITALVVFVIIVLIGSAFLDTTLVRETYARVKMDSLAENVSQFGVENEDLRSEMYDHLRMYRDGGRLVTTQGRGWDYSPVRHQRFRETLAPVLQAYEAGNWEEFQAKYQIFDDAYREMSRSRQRILYTLRYGSGVITFISFFGILIMLFSRLGKADDEALAVQQENDHILASTKEGVFLIDSEFQIGEQQSGAVDELFGYKVDVSGSFLDFIKPLVSDEQFARTEKFLALVFGGRAKPRLMGDLNPLQNVEMMVDRKIGDSVRRVLNFDFSRDEQSDVVEKLLVTVSDITKEALLREELEETQKIQDEKFNLLKGVLHVDPEMLKRFIEKAQGSYREINSLLEAGNIDPDGNLQKIEEIARITHRLKGDASSLRLDLFQASLHRFENTINELRELNLIDGQSLVKLVVQLKEMIAELNLASSLTGQFSVQFMQDVDGDSQTSSLAVDESHKLTEPKDDSDLFTDQLATLIEGVAEREGKQVNFSVSGAKHLNELPDFAEPFREIAVQLARNSVVHGIESPDQRIAGGKPAHGKLHIAFNKTIDQLSMEVIDDGQGLQFEKIKARAIDVGLIDDLASEQLDNKSLFQLIFKHGFSSATGVTEDAGRGVGLDAVRVLVSDIGGRINVGSLANKQAKFTVSVPINDNVGGRS